MEGKYNQFLMGIDHREDEKGSLLSRSVYDNEKRLPLLLIPI